MDIAEREREGEGEWEEGRDDICMQRTEAEVKMEREVGIRMEDIEKGNRNVFYMCAEE